MFPRNSPNVAKRSGARLLLCVGAAVLWVSSAFAAAPVAVDDTFTTGSGATLSDFLSTNDTGLDGPADTYAIATNPPNGTATVNPDGSFTYTPNAGFAGTDVFTYSIDDGAGGTSSASVSVTVASATDFLSVANPLLITPEDTAIPLGLTVSQDLFAGGALHDIISTDVLFRPDDGGSAPLSTTIPAGVTGITITGYSTQSVDTSNPNGTNDDYQLLNVRIDLIADVSSGRVANIVGGGLNNLDQFSWIDVPLGQAALADPTKVFGFSTGGASNPVFSIVGNQLQIVETHTLETVYHIEFTSASVDSTNFLGAASSVQLDGDTQSTIDVAAGVEPATGTHGIVIVTSNSAAGGAFDLEHKGFSRFVIDFDKGTISGAIAALRGETEINTVTYGFEGYPLVDLRDGPAAVSDILSGSATVIGDVTSMPEVLDNPTVYIDTSGDIVFERKTDFADTFTTMYTAEAYERTGFGSIAAFVAVDSDDTLFNSIGGVASDGGPANELNFDVPASAQVGLVQVSWSTVGGNATNENMGAGFAVIDLANGTTSGSIMFLRTTTPDLISWDSVPLNTTIFGATDAAGAPLYESNKTAGTFTDLFGQTARFTLVNLADGSRSIVFTATNGNGNQAFRQYQGNMQISWLGSEPFEIAGVPVTGLLSHGSPTSGGNWEIDFPELPLLSYIPQDHSSDVIDLDFSLSSSGETESVRVYIEPVVDPVTINANDSAGYAGFPIPLSIDVIPSVDVDGSENEPNILRLQGVPASVALSASAGTVTNVSSGMWDISESALATLQASSPIPTSATVFIVAEQTDVNDLDNSGSVDDNANSVGADEFDEATITETFRLDIFDIPTVNPQVTSLASPVITGNTLLAAGESLMVTVNGVTYTNGDGNLVVNANGTWTLTVPAGDALVEGTYSVQAEKSHSAGASASDVTNSELLIDLTPPPAPGVTSQTTQDTTPLISGTTHVGTGDALSVEVNGVVYAEGDGNLVNNGDGTWDLTIPATDTLVDSLYQVIARLTDVAGNVTTDPGVDDLVVDTTAPPTPGVTSLVTNDDTPLILGTASVGAGETLTVEVNGITYTAGDGNLVDNADGTWSLTIPPTDVLPEANYDVTATVIDLAGNLSIDPSSTELTVDLTLPATPVIFSQITINTTPVISGLATVFAGESFEVEVNGVIYSAGDGNLVDNGDGTWDLTIPPSDALLDNIYNVRATVTDIAGNTSSDGTVSELIVDTTAPLVPTVVSLLTNSPTPTVTGTAIVGAGEVLMVEVDGTTYTAGDGNLVDNGNGTWDLSIPAGDALPEAVYDVSVTVTDTVGNFSTDTSSAELTVDLTPPSIPTVDSLVSNSPTPVVTGTATIQAGDVLTVVVNGVSYTAGDGDLNDNGDGTWSLAIPAANALSEAIYDVSVAVEDLAGNSTPDATLDELEIDLTATAAPTVILTADLNNDALLNTAEASNPQPVDIVLPAGAKAGDTLLWTDTVAPANRVLTAADITAGVVSTTVGLAADGSVLTVSSLLVDLAGNASPSGSDSATVDITAPSAPIIVIAEDADNNSFLNIAESNGPIDVSIQLPTGVAAGDTLTLTLDGVVSTIVLSAADITAGVVDVTTPATGNGSTVQAEAFISDPAGNTTPTANDTAVVDISPPFIPTVIPLTTNNVTPTVNGNAAVGPGDVLTVTINGVTYTDGDGSLTNNGSGGWLLDIPTADALVEGTYDVAISLTDPAGNTSVDITVNELVVDTSLPLAPTVVSQVTNSQVPTVSGTATLNAGEVLRVEINGITYTAGDGDLVDNSDGTWTLTIPASDALPEAIYDVNVTITDTAGNVVADPSSGELTVDITATLAPTVVLTADANDDALLNLTEAQSPQPVDIILPASAVVGDTLLWTDSVSPANTVLTAADIAGGVVSTTVALPADGSVLTVSSVLIDLAGNASPSGVDSATVDTTPSDPPQPVIVADADNDGLLNVVEAVSPQPIDITLPTSAALGFTLSANDGTAVTSIVLTAADIVNGFVSITATLPADGSILNVVANLTDLAGNVSTDGSDFAQVDLTIPDQPSIVIVEDSNNDGFINIAENLGLVDVNVLLPATAVAGDALTTSIRGVVLTRVLTAADITAGVLNLTTPAPSNGAFVIAEAFLANSAGNLSTTADDTAQLDISPPFVPTVNSQITNLGTPVVDGTAAVGPGDTLRVAVNGVTYTDGDGNLIDNGDGTWSLTVPASDALLSATYDVAVQIEDPAGNTTQDATVDELVVDLVPPAVPSVDSLLTNLTTPTLTGTAVVNAGESLSVTINGETYTVGDGNLVLAASGVWTLTIPAIDALVDGSYEVLAEVTDTAGNLSSDANANELLVDLTPTVAPTVVLTADVNNDALLNDAEALSPQPVDIILPAGAAVGDTLLWTDSVSPANTLLTAADITAGVVSTTVALPADGSVLTVSSVLIDLAGNASPNGFDSATVDTTPSDPPQPVIVADADNDGLLNVVEAVSPQPIDITLPASAGVGFTLSVNDGTTVTDIVLTAADIVNGLVSTTVTLPADGSILSVVANLTDLAGNVSTDGGDLAQVDLTVPDQPSIVISEDTNNDGFINIAENVGLVDVQVVLPATAVAGDSLTTSIRGVVVTRVLSAADIAAGLLNLTTPAPSNAAFVIAEAFLTDSAGNPSITASDTAQLDISPPFVPTVNSQITNSGTPSIDGTAAVGPGDTLRVAVNGVSYVDGDGNLVDNGDGTWILTVPASDALLSATYDVAVQIEDPAGNTTQDATVGELVVDSVPPAVPVVDALLTNLATPALTGTAVVSAGESLSVTINGVTYPLGDGNLVLAASGVWTLTIPAIDALVDGSYEVLAEVTDAAGNLSSDVSANELVVDLTPTVAPTVVLTADANNDAFLNTAEAVNPQPVDITLPAGAAAGDTLLWTDGVSPANTVLTAADITAGVFSTTVALPADGDVLTVSAVLTDQAGNVSAGNNDSATVDSSPTASPIITITEDADNDSFLNIAESVGLVDVAVQLPTGATVGDSLTLVLDGVTSTTVLSAADITAGVVNVTTPALANGSNLIAEAFITDLAGNVSPTVSDTALVDISAPFVPAVNSLETNNTTPTLTGNAAVGPGDVLTVTVNGITYTAGDGSLVDNGSGAWALTIPSGDALTDGTYDVTVSLTDPAGNNTLDITTDELIVDTALPAVPSVTSLITNSQEPALEGTAIVAPGDTLRVAVNGVTYVAGSGSLVDNGDGTWVLTIPAANALPEANYNVTATVSDAAGNVSADPTSAELTVDLTATVAPTVVLTADLNDDALLSAAEAQDPQPVDIVLPAGAVVGDTLLWTDTVSPANTVLTAVDIAAGVVSTTVSLPADGSVLTVSAVLLDQAGNASPSGDDSATVDNSAPAIPSIVIAEDADDNGFLNIAEANGPVDVTVLLPLGVVVGDTLTVILNGAVSTFVLTATDIAAGVINAETPALANNSTVLAEAFITDIAGNTTATVDDTALVDISAPFVPTAHSLITNNATPTLTGNAAVGPGDVLTVTVNGITYTDGDGFLTYNGAGAWALAIPASDALADATYDVAVSLTDPAGNTSVDITVDELVIDTVVPQAAGVTSQTTPNPTPVISGTTPVNPGLSLTVEVNGVIYSAGDGNLVVNSDGTWDLTIPAADALADGLYQVIATVTDLAGNSTVDSGVDDLVIDTVSPSTPGVTSQVTNTTVPIISGTATVAVGETLTVSVNGITYTAGDGNLVDNGDGTWLLAIPVADALPEAVYSVTATVIDLAGNASVDPSSTELTIDLTAPDVPTVTPQLSNVAEPTVAGTAVLLLGETLNVTVNGVQYTAGDSSLVDNGDGTWMLTIPALDALAEGIYDVAVEVIDLAGNRTTDVSINELEIDLSSTAAPTPILTADINNDAFLNASEAQVLQAVTILLPAGAAVGDDLLWSDGITPANTVLSAADIAAGAVQTAVPLPADGSVLTVSAVLVDLAGNASPAGSDSATVDSTVPDAPMIVIVEDANDDSFLNLAESMGPVDVVINLPDSAIVGDILVFTINGVTSSVVLSAADIALGAVSSSTPAPAQGVDVVAEAFVVDTAGNSSVVADDLAVVDNSAPFIPSVNPLITNAVAPVLTGNAAVGPGDLLEVTVNGITYIDGDGALVNNGNGTWSLAIPTIDALVDASYEVAIRLTDPAGNSTEDVTVNELVVDTVAPQAPAVTSQTTNDQTPIISGSYTVATGYTLNVLVNGVVYTQGDGQLTANPDGTWDLQIPTINALPDALYQVVATITDLAGNVASDSMVDDLLVDTALPASPGITSLITNSGTPVIQGTVFLAPGETFSVTVNGVQYLVGDGHLIVNADGTWSLNIPASDELTEGIYDVVASVTDAAGNVSSDPSSSELVIDLTVPAAPSVVAQPTNSQTPVFGGTVELQPGEVFTVTVNGVTYTVGDGNLVLNPDGTWQLTIPASDALPEGVYNVVATVTDSAGNVTSDTTLDELIIDLTPPPEPSFTNALTNSTTPVLGGQVQLAPGDVFTVSINGVTYTVGDGFLTLDANGNWELTIDPSQPLVDGTYDVMLTIVDVAGNSVTNASGQQITIDTGAPSLTVNAINLVTTFQPLLSGTSDSADGSVVVIRDAEGNVVCEAVVTDGLWACTPTLDLNEGVNNFTAEVADSASNLMTVNFSLTVSTDFDGDGIANSIEGFGDTDGDGVPDSRDLDADNDGIPDADESTIDSDGDGLPNYLDGDADNDGLADILEVEGLDADRDFRVDDFVDNDNNGLSDDLQVIPLTVVDTDFDGVPNYLDVDSDNDGVPDIQEHLGADADNDGRIDAFVDLDSDGVDDSIQAFPLSVLDTDDNGVPNHLDLDSDSDGLSDVLESVGIDVNNDSIVDSMTDADQDSIPDSVDFSIIGGSDADGDDIEDSADVDFILGDDTDGDGIVDEFDPDANGDGFFDASFADASLPDTDDNGVPDLQEAFGQLRTGRRGVGGCAIDTGGVSSRDPLLIFLVLFALAGLLRQRRKVVSVSRVSESKSSHWMVCLFLCAAFLFHTDKAQADDAGKFHKRFYVGAGAGVSYLDPDESEIPFNLVDQSDFAWGGYVGYDVGSRVSVELGFNDLGQAELDQDHFVTYQQTSISALFYGLNRKSDRERRTGASAFARLGVSRMENESDIGFVRDNDFSVTVGLGAELGFKNGLALRGEITSYDVDSNYAGISLLYRFGHATHKDNFVEKRPVPDVVEPKPAITPPLAAPEPTPEPTPEPESIVEEVEPTVPGPVSVDVVEYAVLFDTNSVELDAEAESVVDEIEDYLRMDIDRQLDVTGYADLLGPVVYNLRLSEQRAQSVARSLVRRGIAEKRIKVEAGGETDQFGLMSTEFGRRQNRRAHVSVFEE